MNHEVVAVVLAVGENATIQRAGAADVRRNNFSIDDNSETAGNAVDAFSRKPSQRRLRSHHLASAPASIVKGEVDAVRVFAAHGERFP